MWEGPQCPKTASPARTRGAEAPPIFFNPPSAQVYNRWPKSRREDRANAFFVRQRSRLRARARDLLSRLSLREFSLGPVAAFARIRCNLRLPSRFRLFPKLRDRRARG